MGCNVFLKLDYGGRTAWLAFHTTNFDRSDLETILRGARVCSTWQDQRLSVYLVGRNCNLLRPFVQAAKFIHNTRRGQTLTHWFTKNIVFSSAGQEIEPPIDPTCELLVELISS
nr:non-structural protein 1 [Swine orthopneumovirus]